MAELSIRNVRPILGTLRDPNLPRAAVDLILMVDVYHEFDHPYEMAQSMSAALKPGGRMVFVEFRGEDAREAQQLNVVVEFRQRLAILEHTVDTGERAPQVGEAGSNLQPHGRTQRLQHRRVPCELNEISDALFPP